MLHILDILAVREAVALQPPRLRVICELLMQGLTQEQVAEELGCAQCTVSRKIGAIRKSFIKMGFEWTKRRVSRDLRRRVLGRKSRRNRALRRRAAANRKKNAKRTA